MRELPYIGVNANLQPILDAKLSSIRELRTVLARSSEPSDDERLAQAALKGLRGDDALRTRWRALIHALAILDARPLEDDGLRELLYEQWLLDAVRAVAVLDDDTNDERRCPASWRALLLTEGSAESLDALLPFIDQTLRNGDGLERLLELRRFASSKLASDLLRNAAQRREALVGAAHDLAMRRGIAQTGFFFRLFFASTQRRGDTPLCYGRVVIDARQADWLELALTYGASQMTRFSANAIATDELGIGRCAPDELPQFLARASARLDVRLGVLDVDSDLDERSRKCLTAWLLGALPYRARRLPPLNDDGASP
jgi:hypothetical protein